MVKVKLTVADRDIDNTPYLNEKYSDVIFNREGQTKMVNGRQENKIE